MRHVFWGISFGAFGLTALIGFFWPPFLWVLLVLVPLFVLGVRDCFQRNHAVLRNFPVLGHMRYLLESIRPEINQYFVESETDGQPFNRELRSIVYQRAKRALSTLPFGTKRDVYEPGYEWINHSMRPLDTLSEEPRVTIGGPHCKKPYSASLFNVSAMSYGALSKNAIRALNGGAALGGFYHNTGEGGVSSYHLSEGGDLVWQIGTGYFGCRDTSGRFDSGPFRETSRVDSVKMIEVKLSQGAKPGHGGILPRVKISPEIARIRGVSMDKDIVSPPYHTAFDSPRGLLEFVQHLREESGGKPVGIKLCVGNPAEMMSLCKAMHETELTPDYIAVDGGEGGTGAAPLEFSNSVGMPLSEGLTFVHNALVGFQLRERVRLVAGGKVVTGFSMAQRIALGADLCTAARGMMLALGCIQALRCNENTCPVGVATQNPRLVAGLDPEDKRHRVYNFHRETVHSFLELLAAAGLARPQDLKAWHINRRVSRTEVLNYAQIFPSVEPGGLLRRPVPPAFEHALLVASSESF